MPHSLTKKAVKKLLNAELFRFVIVGGIATVIHYGIYLLLNQFLNANVAYTLGYFISWCCNFYLSSKFTFKSKASVKKGVGFAASHLINYFLHILFLNLFLHIGIDEKYAPILVYCCVIPINFVLVRTVFKSKWFQK